MDEALGIKWVFNNYYSKDKISIDHLNESTADKIIHYHKSFPIYKETPLVSLKSLADRLSIGNIYVKDESKRFDLNAFKVLGGSYAIAVYLAERFGLELSNISYNLLKGDKLKDEELIFVTATDGNHGRGIAWTARQLGYKSVVFMPKGSSVHRIESIRDEGAKVEVLDCNYDDAVRYAKKYAEENKGILVQDTALDNYIDIPIRIMQGYITIAHEISTQLNQEEKKPTHLILQAGVGSFAASMLGYFRNKYGENIKTLILEPKNADCIFKSALINDGKPHIVKGDLETIMAGLSCGEPNPIAWPILRDYGDLFVSCPDYVAEKGMVIMANPVGNDERIISGESGAPGLGLLKMIMEEEKLKKIKEKLEFNESSNVIIISTEGDTDPDSYKKIIAK
ncbi:MAG: diaminopropionate ammonia-lyase [Firmicutes bacterium]|nr:diaminopropionate ammonia-lyase [Bacillota bacterium]